MEFEVSRRRMFGLVGVGAVGLLTGACGAGTSPGAERASSSPGTPTWTATPSASPDERTMTVFKDPSCGCCDGWVQHMRDGGFEVSVEPVDSLRDVFAADDIPADVQSCHLARTTAGALLVGHVPARFAVDYLADPPKRSRGLAVPGMPVGTPGMEMGDRFEPYEVLLLGPAGSAGVFASVGQASDQRA